MIKDYVNIVIKNLRSRKTRSFLTLIGIVIGVVAIVLLYTFGQSMENLAGQQFDKLGTNRILIGPKMIGFHGPGSARSLTDDDVKVVEKVIGVEYVNAIIQQTTNIKYGQETAFIRVIGLDTRDISKSFADIGIEILEGREMVDGEEGFVAVIGYKLAKEYFDKEIRVNSVIRIQDRKFTVIGILKEQGNQDDDMSLRIPLDAAREVFNIDDAISAMSVTIHDGLDLNEVSKKIEKDLERFRDDEDFTVTNPVELQEQSRKILGVITLVIVAIGLVALVVGGIGITNSMYTAVLERTAEIGTMKAVGARNGDILMIFLIESSFMGFIGGIVAIIISVILIYISNAIIAQFDLISVDILPIPSVLIAALVFSVVTGIIAGLMPAYKASKLKPVDALRYE